MTPGTAQVISGVDVLRCFGCWTWCVTPRSDCPHRIEQQEEEAQ